MLGVARQWWWYEAWGAARVLWTLKLLHLGLGGAKLLYDGHMYYRRDTKKGTTYWNRVKKGECKATASTKVLDQKLEVLKTKPHTHAPNQEEVQAEKTVQNLKRIASDHPELPPAQILRRAAPRFIGGPQPAARARKLEEGNAAGEKQRPAKKSSVTGGVG